MAALSGGHLLIEDVPGVGKTVLARALAASLGAELSRVQGHPDLLPSDVTGVSVFAPDTGTWEFRPGPVFAHVVLVDELNRTPPRTQAAAARDDGGAAGERGRRVVAAAAPAPRHRHPEPLLPTRDLSPGGEPARPLRAGHGDRLPRRRHRGAAGAARRRQVRPRRAPGRVQHASSGSAAQRATESVDVAREPWPSTPWRCAGPAAAHPGCASGPARAPPSGSSAPPRPTPCCRRDPSSPPTT